MADTNIQKAKDYFKIGITVFEDAISDFREKRTSSSVLHARQAVLLFCKSVLAFTGLVFSEVQFPAEIISKELLSNPDRSMVLGITQEQIKQLIAMVINAKSLEVGKDFPVLGWEIKDRIVHPDEIFDKELSSYLLERATNVFESIVNFYDPLELPNEFKELINEGKGILSNVTKEFRTNS